MCKNGKRFFLSILSFCCRSLHLHLPLCQIVLRPFRSCFSTQTWAAAEGRKQGEIIIPLHWQMLKRKPTQYILLCYKNAIHLGLHLGTEVLHQWQAWIRGILQTSKKKNSLKHSGVSLSSWNEVSFSASSKEDACKDLCSKWRGTSSRI